MLCFVIISICFIYMFMSNLVGQQIIDHNNYIFVTAYKVQWYVTPLPIQRLILILLQRGNKSFGLKVGGLFVASLECFSTLINASVSYFIVMYSMRS
ncbi:PREDICTED: odorant receptor 43a-like [Trachymyrmex septentrionalis]|uniref:odorant receptor 43a-like n=1 Tax=Trachymyrmex septentrionalis TaxID=34720 RepID=UPI00084F0EAF|nr:PREDICTED: odorant receptor 43a-like [Trachymyrmex septentrionalis]